ncbi:MAG TPA: hypothetical protein VF756_19685 [Thermoanaerobaculia bacterium]
MLKREGQNSQEEALRVYFAKPPQKESITLAVILLAAGGFFLFMTFIAFSGDMNGVGGSLLILALALGAAGGFLLASVENSYKERLREFANLPNRPSDQQVQQWFQEGIQRLTTHSRYFFRLDELERTLSDPLRVQSPILWQITGVDNRDLLWKKGDDGALRFGVYRINIIWLTDHHLASYTCYYDFIRDIAVNECADEVHYRDAVLFSTRETSSTSDRYSANLETGKKASFRHEFIVTVPSGEALRVTLDEAYIQQITGEERPFESGADRAIAVIRARLREEKRRETETAIASAA